MSHVSEVKQITKLSGLPASAVLQVKFVCVWIKMPVLKRAELVSYEGGKNKIKSHFKG